MIFGKISAGSGARGAADAMSPELHLLIACAKPITRPDDEALIRRILSAGIDWAIFARKSIDHGLAGLAGQTLGRVASDLVPEDILDAFRMNLDQTRSRNRELFAELTTIVRTLADDGIEAIPFKGPVIAIQAYGDIGLRVFRDLDFLIRDRDIRATREALRRLGYERPQPLTEAQIDMIEYLQGQDLVMKKSAGIAVEPHSRLISAKMALDIDYEGLWRRARQSVVEGQSMTVFAPEDHLQILAVHGGKEMWWRISWVCDIAAFIESHPSLDWNAILMRARQQGSLRMLLLAASLVRQFSGAPIPDAVMEAARADPAIPELIRNIAAGWSAEVPLGPPSNKTVSVGRLRLHDGIGRRARYVARTLFLPGPHHVAWVALPRLLAFAYIPLKLVHDLALLPLWRIRGYASPYIERIAKPFVALSIPSAERLRRVSHEEARDAAERAVRENPKNAGTWHKLAEALLRLDRPEEAVRCYDKALSLSPDDKAVFDKRESVKKSFRLSAVPAYLDMILAIEPHDADSWVVRAGAFFLHSRLTEAQEACNCALELEPSHATAIRIGVRSRLEGCDWRQRDTDTRQLKDGQIDGKYVITPLDHRTLFDCEPDHASNTRLWAGPSAVQDALQFNGGRNRHDKIRLAYISTDFRSHAVGYLMVGCFEHHDKSRFETTAISLSASDNSGTRRRIESAFDRFIDAQEMGNADVVKLMRELEIDIAIDLNGFTGARRTGILAQRAASIQVNFLGFPGSMQVPFIDYVIADRTIIPPANEAYYTEKIAYLPRTYLPTDAKRRIAIRTPSRQEAGLPESGFVFACHNNVQKITPAIFDAWMRILRSVEGSVLWLRCPSPVPISNLRREASARNVSPERLLFAPKVAKVSDQLARLRLADLFLDTLPYNGHTTACDALWAGLPVLTCIGNSFQSRVAASLLRAIDMPELITSSMDEYESLALTLAHQPDRLAALRAKLAENRDTTPLFNTAKYTRELEAAYTTMWERHTAGKPPATFDVVDFSPP